MNKRKQYVVEMHITGDGRFGYPKLIVEAMDEDFAALCASRMMAGVSAEIIKITPYEEYRIVQEYLEGYRFMSMTEFLFSMLSSVANTDAEVVDKHTFTLLGYEVYMRTDFGPSGETQLYIYFSDEYDELIETYTFEMDNKNPDLLADFIEWYSNTCREIEKETYRRLRAKYPCLHEWIEAEDEDEVVVFADNEDNCEDETCEDDE